MDNTSLFYRKEQCLAIEVEQNFKETERYVMNTTICGFVCAQVCFYEGCKLSAQGERFKVPNL